MALPALKCSLLSHYYVRGTSWFEISICLISFLETITWFALISFHFIKWKFLIQIAMLLAFKHIYSLPGFSGTQTALWLKCLFLRKCTFLKKNPYIYDANISHYLNSILSFSYLQLLFLWEKFGIFLVTGDWLHLWQTKLKSVLVTSKGSRPWLHRNGKPSL